MVGKKKRILLICLALVLLAVLALAAGKLWDIRRQYAAESEAHQALLPYRPDPDALSPAASRTDDPAQPETGAAPVDSTAAEPEPVFVNETIRRLRADHPNALGWISVPGTNIEYPIVQGPDNDYFLRRDVDGNSLYAGVPFLDYRCRPDLSGVNSVIYGHNLRNGTMFGALEQFQEQGFFDEHREIIVWLEDRTVRAETVACLLIDPRQKEYVYAVQPEADHLARLLADAVCAKPCEASPAQRFLTLSTCGYAFSEARIVLVGIIQE